MVTGSLTTRWSYPEAEVDKFDLQHSHGDREESKKSSLTVVNSSTMNLIDKSLKDSRR
jgi:hypothetical protein